MIGIKDLQQKEVKENQESPFHWIEHSHRLERDIADELVLSRMKRSIGLHPLSDFLCRQLSCLLCPLLHLSAALSHVLNLLCHLLLHVLHLLSDSLLDMQPSLLH